MRRDRFSFAIRVARQIDRVRRTSGFPQIVYDFAFAAYDLQRRLKDIFVIQPDDLSRGFLFYFRGLFTAFFRLGFLFLSAIALFFSGQTDTDRLFRQVQHVADRRFDEKILPQILVDGLRLCRRFHNYQRTSHVAVLPRNLLREGPQARAVSFSLPYITELSSLSCLQLTKLPATEEPC